MVGVGFEVGRVVFVMVFGVRRVLLWVALFGDLCEGCVRLRGGLFGRVFWLVFRLLVVWGVWWFVGW